MNRPAQTYPQLAVQLARTGWVDADLTLVRTAHELAASMFAGAERGCGKPFIDHLVGTASCVVLGGGSPTVAAAALLHAAYDQGDFGDGRPGAGRSHRHRVRRAVGEAAERLVHDYSMLDWGPEAAADACRGIADLGPEQREVLLLRVANEIDDALDAGLVIAGKTRSGAQRRELVGAIASIAPHVGTPELSELVRLTLLEDPPAIPRPLLLGVGGSWRRMPASARVTSRVRATIFVRRVRARMWRTVRHRRARSTRA